MVHLLGKVWHIAYQNEAHELLCLRVRHALGYLEYARRTHKCTRKVWVGAGMWWVQDSEKYGILQQPSPPLHHLQLMMWPPSI